MPKVIFLQAAEFSQLKPKNYENGHKNIVDYFNLPLLLVPKLRSVAQNEWKKHPYIFFLFVVQN